jgi:hypothetical protein
VYDGILCQPVCSPTAGTPIHVQAGRATSGIVIVVDGGTSVSGVIRDADTSLPLSGVTVSMTDASGMFIASTGTDLNGAYEFRDLGPGRYFIRTLNRIGYVDELFDNQGCSSCVNSPATPIDVAGASPVSGIDFRLTRGGWIAGRVTDANGAPVANLGVSVYDSAGAKLQRAVTASDGTYIVTVPAGPAFVQSDLLSGFRVVTYPDVVCSTSSCSPLAGTAVAVVAGAQTEGIDLELPIVQSLTITPAFLAGGETGQPYSATIQVVNGSAPVEVAVVSGALPPGLTLDVDQPLARARLLGTPTTTGVFGFAIRALDSGGRFVQRLFSITISPCVVAISQDEIAFAMSGGSARIRVAGGCGWQAATSASWITVASAAAEVTITVPPTSAARSANVTVASRTVVVRQAGPESAAPFGFLDIPSEGSRAVGSIAVGGWALDDVGIVRVSIYRDSVAPELPNQLVYLGDAVRVRGARPDVESLYPSMPFRDRAGWGFLLLTNMLPNQGNGTFRLHAVAEDVESKRVLLGSRTIVADNATATVPFGAIDTPGQGETISGNAYVNFGWALTQLPKTIPFDGSTITVYIDGASVGTVDYNHFRPDVATFFPGLNNTNGAIGFRILDTTQLTDGIHTISWGVTDDGGATEGIGSRYFHVDNTSPAFGGSFTESPNVEAAEVSSVSTARSDRTVRIREMERLTLDLAPQLGSPSGCPAALAGYEVVGHARRPLPAGSAFDPATAHFTWQPGPGFLGTYRLVFSATSCDGSVTDVPIDVRIVRSAR